MTEAFLTLGISPEQLTAIVLASILSGIVGTLVVLRRLVALAGGLAHAAFGGIGSAVALGIDPRWGASAVALAAATLLAGFSRRRSVSQDAAIGVLWAVGMAVGMVLLSASRSDHGEIEGYLFGDIARVRSATLLFMATLVALVLAVYARFGRELLATAFDVDHARLKGVPVRALGWIELSLVALSLVALLELAGVVLAIALLAIPPLVSARLSRGLPAMVLGATLTAAVMSLAGLALAGAAGWPAGPAIALVGGALLALSRLRPVPTRSAR